MSDELKHGAYWVRWGTGKPWEAFDFTGREAFIPAEIGPRILSAEELLANSEELTRLRAENVALRKFVNPRGHLEDCSIRSVGELRKRIKDDTHVPRCSCGLSAFLTTPTSEAAGEPAAENKYAKCCGKCRGRGHRRLDISDIPGSALNDGMCEGIATCEACNGTGKEPAAPSVRPNCIFDGGNPERCFQCHKQYQSEPLPRPCSAAPSVTTEGGKSE